MSTFMDKTWAISGVEPATWNCPGNRVRAGLERPCARAVQAGRLVPGNTDCPSSRALAPDLGIARNTVAEAYGQLSRRAG